MREESHEKFNEYNKLINQNENINKITNKPKD